MEYIIVALVAILMGLCAFAYVAIKDLRKERDKNHTEYIVTMDKLMETSTDKEQLNRALKEEQDSLLETQEDLGKERERNKTLLSQKKSSETRLGQISEHLVPFLANCNHDPKNLHFMGNPIDYIAFDFDEGKITFIEIKSGNSKTSKRQKTIKNVIKSGRIYFEEIRINEKGVKSKKAENE